MSTSVCNVRKCVYTLYIYRSVSGHSLLEQIVNVGNIKSITHSILILAIIPSSHMIHINRYPAQVATSTTYTNVQYVDDKQTNLDSQFEVIESIFICSSSYKDLVVKQIHLHCIFFTAIASS